MEIPLHPPVHSLPHHRRPFRGHLCCSRRTCTDASSSPRSSARVGFTLGLVSHSSFTARNILCPPLTHPSFPRLLTTTGPLSVPKALPFPECHVVGIAQMGCFRLAVYIYSSSVSLRGRQLIGLALSTVPLPGGTTTCPSPAEGKGIVVPSKLHQLWIKPP